MANVLTRYGHSEFVNDPADQWLTKLIDQLRTEQFDEPDDEHTQVSVANEHWSVSAQVSGLITFDNLDLLEGKSSELPETMYTRDVSDTELISLWQAVIREDVQALLAYPWRPLPELPPFTANFYHHAK